MDHGGQLIRLGGDGSLPLYEGRRISAETAAVDFPSG